jgi:hypothetical protein
VGTGATVSVPRSVSQYVARVVVQVARATARPVAEVARDSFALTLWTWGEIMAMDREATVERMGERTDLAGLVAVAFHEPSKLQQAELRYLKAAGRLTSMIDQAKARALALVAQHERLAVVGEG